MADHETRQKKHQLVANCELAARDSRGGRARLPKPHETRTENYLIEELGKNGRHRSLAALAGIGYLASPKFKDVTTGFIAEEPEVSTRDNFPDGRPRKTKEYAPYRCRGIQNRQLLRDANGTFYIKEM